MDRTGLWYHSKKCDFQTNTLDAKIFIDLLKQNQDFKEIILEQNVMLNEQNSKIHEQNNKIIQVLETSICNNTTNNQVNTINSNNKTFNLQVFLNEDCKDAMNITELADSINLQLSDLESVGRLGYIDGISNIIIKNLKALDIHKKNYGYLQKNNNILNNCITIFQYEQEMLQECIKVKPKY